MEREGSDHIPDVRTKMEKSTESASLRERNFFVISSLQSLNEPKNEGKREESEFMRNRKRNETKEM